MQVTQQGRLVDADGAPLTGSHTIHFSLFASDDGTGQQWTESQTVVLDEGYYSVVLGSDTGTVLDSGILSLQPLFLGMSIDSGDLMMPLLEVTSAPYAIVADSALNVSGGSVDSSAIYVDGTLVVDGNGDWVGNVLPGTLESLGCADGEEARYTTASGWVCAHPGEHYTNAEAVAAMGAAAPTNPLNHDRYTAAEAVAAMGAAAPTNPLNHDRYTAAEALADLGPHYTNAEALAAVSAADEYVKNSGDAMSGDLRMQSNDPSILFDDTSVSGSLGAEWELRGSSGSFEINQPSLTGSGTTNLRVVGGSSGSVQLRPNNNSTLTAHASGNVVVDEQVFSKRYAFAARSSAAYQPTNGVPLFIDYELIDTHNGYGGPNFKYYTVPRSGLYSISMSFSFTGGDGNDDTWELKLYKNGVHTNNPPNSAAVLQTLYTNPRWTSRNGKESNASMTAIVDLNAGDRLQILAREIGSNTPVRVSRSYFSGFYLGD